MYFSYCPLCLCKETGDAGLPGYFLNLGFGARALGMGRAHVAVVDDSNAIGWNPAGLSRLPKMQVQFMYVNLFEDTRYNTIAYALPIADQLVLGLGFAQLYSSDFVMRDNNNNEIGKFSDQNTAGFLGFGSYY